MNIVLYVNSFLPNIGGREIVVHYLARSLTMLGHKVRVVGPAGWWSYRKTRYEYLVHRWPTLRGLFTDRVAFTQLLLDTTIWGCDVIHAHSTYPSGFAAAKLKAIRNIPLVVTPHGEDIHVIPEIAFGQRLDPIQRPKIEFSLQKAELLTAISDSVEDSLLGAGAPQGKIRKIPNGVDIDRFQSPVSTTDVRKWLQFPEDSRLIVTVGNYHPRKGHEVLIRAMPIILESEPRSRLVIVGRNSGELKPFLREFALEGKVKLTGPINFPSITSNDSNFLNSKKPDWLAGIYGSSEMYVSSGLGEGAEGLSLAILEAMAAGLPVVATNISGNRDIIKNGENGFLVPPDDPAHLAEAILWLLNDNQTRIRMGADAKDVAKGYGWQQIIQKYLAVYQEAIDLKKQEKLNG